MFENWRHCGCFSAQRELAALRPLSENEKLNRALAKLKVEHQAVKDEPARLKGLPPRPPHISRKVNAEWPNDDE